MHNVSVWAAQAPPSGAKHATLAEVRQLIGNLSTPQERAVFQLFVSASRFSESQNRISSDGQLNYHTWNVSYWKQHGVIQLSLRTHKAAPTGQRPYSKWIKTPFPGAFKPHNLGYWELLSYIKSKFPDLSCHSLRKLALQHLTDVGFSPRETALLSGHGKMTQYRSMARSYVATRPDHEDAITCSKMSTELQKAVLPRHLLAILQGQH